MTLNFFEIRLLKSRHRRAVQLMQSVGFLKFIKEENIMDLQNILSEISKLDDVDLLVIFKCCVHEFHCRDLRGGVEAARYKFKEIKTLQKANLKAEMKKAKYAASKVSGTPSRSASLKSEMKKIRQK